MKNYFIVSLILLLSCGIESKTDLVSKKPNEELKTNEVTAQKVIGIDSLKEAHEDELFFLGFWNGMPEFIFKEVYDAEINKKSISRDTSYSNGQQYIMDHYVFKFENKLQLPIPDYTYDWQDFLEYEVSINPKFKDDKLVELELRKGLKAAIKLISPSIDKEELQKEMNIESYSEGELIKLYKQKYGTPNTTKGEYSQAYRKESVVLTWILGNKVSAKQNAVIIEYLSKDDNSINLKCIKYVDWVNYNQETSKYEADRKTTLEKNINDI